MQVEDSLNGPIIYLCVRFASYIKFRNTDKRTKFGSEHKDNRLNVKCSIEHLTSINCNNNWLHYRLLWLILASSQEAFSHVVVGLIRHIPPKLNTFHQFVSMVISFPTMMCI